MNKLQQHLTADNIDLAFNKWVPGIAGPTINQPLLMFCPIVSRLGTDIDSMVNSTNLKGKLHEYNYHSGEFIKPLYHSGEFIILNHLHNNY
jgi:hypothetical protein